MYDLQISGQDIGPSLVFAYYYVSAIMQLHEIPQVLAPEVRPVPHWICTVSRTHDVKLATSAKVLGPIYSYICAGASGIK